MTLKLTKLTGSGSVLKNSEISFSYSEDVSSLEPSDIGGGNGQLTVNAIAQTGGRRSDTRLLINNEMSIEDSDAGSIEFKVQKVSINNDLANILGGTVQAQMNVERTAQPVTGSDLNPSYLVDALDYYCGLVDVYPDYDEDLLPYLESKRVNFMGWTGNVWEKLKELCAGVSANDTEDIPIEMFVDVNALKFRIANTRTADLISNASNVSFSVDAFDAAQAVDITYYETRYQENGIIREDNAKDDAGSFVRNVSILDQLQVNAGETVIKRYKINASLESINQPQIKSEITSIPYTGTTGEYVIFASEDLPIMPEQWIKEGGKLEVRLTENPNEIEIQVTAPEAESLPLADDVETFSEGPYKIGIEDEYPAFYITGTGVFFEEKRKRFLTGGSSETAPETQSSTITNIFINKKNDLYTKGLLAAQKLCGPRCEIQIDNPVDIKFGSSIGAVVDYQDNKYRIQTASFGYGTASATGVSVAEFGDFNPIWTGKTFAEFTQQMLEPIGSPDDYLTFNEFSTIPLMEA